MPVTDSESRVKYSWKIADREKRSRSKRKDDRATALLKNHLGIANPGI